MNHVCRKAARGSDAVTSALPGGETTGLAACNDGAGWAAQGTMAADVVSGSAHAQIVRFHALADALRREMEMARETASLTVPPALLPFADHAQRMVASWLDSWLDAINAYGRMVVRKAAAPAGYARRSH